MNLFLLSESDMGHHSLNSLLCYYSLGFRSLFILCMYVFKRMTVPKLLPGEFGSASHQAPQGGFPLKKSSLMNHIKDVFILFLFICTLG